MEERTYEVCKGTGPAGTDVLSCVDVRTTTSPDIPLAPFLEDPVSRGATGEDSWVTSVRFGFEPWRGGEGLAVDDFTGTPPTDPAHPGDDDDGGRAIVGAASDRWLDVAGRSSAPGALVQLWTCQGEHDTQQWAREGDTVVDTGSGLCLDVARGATAGGSRVQQWTCRADAPGQQWTTS